MSIHCEPLNDVAAGGNRCAARRVLAILECRDSDDAVCARAVELVEEHGGFMTLVAVVPAPFPTLSGGLYCAPSVTRDELWDAASVAIARTAAQVPPHVCCRTVIETGRLARVIGHRTDVVAPDVIVLRERSRRYARGLTVPVELVDSRERRPAFA